MTSECTHHQLFFKDSMNARTLEHKGTMVEIYSKTKPDTFHGTVANSLDRLLRGDQGGCERQLLHQVLGIQAQVRGPDLHQTPTQPTQPTLPTLPTPTPPPPLPRLTGAQQPHPTGRGFLRPPALGARAGAARRGRREGVVERLARPRADAD
jgi:hypothetical protein